MSLKNFEFSFEKDNITKKYIVPKKIIACEGIENFNLLLCDTPRQPTLGKTDICTIKQGGFVVLDFGSELQGGVEVTTNKVISNKKAGMYCSYGKMRVVFGESVSESLSTIGENGAGNEHSIRDMVVNVSNWSTSRYGNTGFRFVKLEAIDGILEITAVKGVLEYKDIEYKGSFYCNDKRINEVFNTAVYTLHLNMQDYLLEGIKRDRLVWTGDMHPEVSTICSVFGYDEVVEKSLDFAKTAYPIDQKVMWMSFPSYTGMWITIHRDWYMQNGRVDYLLEQKDYMYNACNALINRVGDNGELDFGNNYYVDWSSAESPYAEVGFRGCLIRTLTAAADIFQVYGDSDMRGKCLKAAENVKKIVPDYSGNKQTCAIAALAELIDIKKAEAVITKDLLQGLSTFYGYYVLNALAKADNVTAALQALRGYWGAMLDLGATTFWEDFDINWIENAGRIDEMPITGKIDVHSTYGKFCYQKLRLSLCHGCASGPADFLLKNVLGVQIIEAGCKKIRVTPNLGDLTWVKGTYPTPYGIIKIEHKKENGRVVSKIDAPTEIEIVKE